jgi:AraC-like DNA-binding protein
VLVATSELAIGAARMRSALLLERAVRGTVIRREGLAFDTRFAARAAGRAERCGHVFLLLDGRFVWEGGEYAAPVAFVLGDDEIERVGPTSNTFRTDGPRVTVIQLRIEQRYLRWPIGLPHGPIEIELEEPERFRRLWSALQPLYTEYGATASIKQLASALGMSMRQVGRDAKELAATFGVGDGYRDSLLMLRLRTAALMLSAEGATVAEVARLVGYGSPIARSRIDCDIPPISVDRRRRVTSVGA